MEVIKKKVIAVGNCGCGKTGLLTMISSNEFTENCTPTAFVNKYAARVKQKGKQVELALVDTSGEIFGRLARLWGRAWS